MKQRNRKRFDPAFKAHVALAAVQERESLAQLGKKFGVHPVRVALATTRVPLLLQGCAAVPQAGAQA